MMVEAMAATQAATFYACDYSTKPNMTCAPLLVNLQKGIEKLERTLAEEHEKDRLEEMRVTGVAFAVKADGSSVDAQMEFGEKRAPNTSQATPAKGSSTDPKEAAANNVDSNNQKKPRAMTKLEREASRRLIRQATAMQSAQVKGHCLMIMQVFPS